MAKKVKSWYKIVRKDTEVCYPKDSKITFQNDPGMVIIHVPGIQGSVYYPSKGSTVYRVTWKMGCGESAEIIFDGTIETHFE